MKFDLLKKIDKEVYILLTLFLITIIIRILFKNGSVFHWDSLKDVLMIEQTLITGKLQYSYAYGAPGMIIFVFLFYWLENLITGTTSAETSYFFATFLTTGLSIVLLYLISKTITKDKFISISAALILCFNAIFLSVTTYPKTHAIALFFILTSMYLIFSYNKLKKTWPIILSGVFFGLSVAIRILNVFLILPMLLLYLNPKKMGDGFSIKKDKLKLKNLIYFSISSIGTWYSLFYNKIKEVGGLLNYLESLLIEQNVAVGWQGLISPSLKISLNYLYQSITAWGLILLILGTIICIKKQKKLFIFLMLWILPALIYFGNILMPQARFFIILLPALSLLIAIGARHIYNKNKILGILSILILIILMFSTAYPIINHRHNYSGPEEFALWINEQTEENAIIITNDLGFFIEYYGNRTTLSHPRSGDSEEINAFIRRLKNYSNGEIPIYSTGEGFSIDPEKKVLIEITKHFEITLIGEKETEAYQYAELELRKYKEKLFKLN